MANVVTLFITQSDPGLKKIAGQDGSIDSALNPDQPVGMGQDFGPYGAPTETQQPSSEFLPLPGRNVSPLDLQIVLQQEGGHGTW